jgi:hypothetical protein
VTSYLNDVDEQFPNFGLSGALVFAAADLASPLLTWLLLAVVFRGTEPEVRETTPTAGR